MFLVLVLISRRTGGTCRSLNGCFVVIKYQNELSLKSACAHTLFKFGKCATDHGLGRHRKVEGNCRSPVRHGFGQCGQQRAKAVRSFKYSEGACVLGKFRSGCLPLIGLAGEEPDKFKSLHRKTAHHQRSHNRADAGYHLRLDSGGVRPLHQRRAGICEQWESGIGDNGDLLPGLDHLDDFGACFLLVMLVHLDQLLRDVIVPQQPCTDLEFLADHQIGIFQCAHSAKGNIVGVANRCSDQIEYAGYLAFFFSSTLSFFISIIDKRIVSHLFIFGCIIAGCILIDGCFFDALICGHLFIGECAIIAGYINIIGVSEGFIYTLAVGHIFIVQCSAIVALGGHWLLIVKIAYHYFGISAVVLTGCVVESERSYHSLMNIRITAVAGTAINRPIKPRKWPKIKSEAMSTTGCSPTR
jgi:hypothetical protein